MIINHNSQRSKSLGQNFLTDPALLDQLAEAADVTAGDSVLEIGAGLGGLTVALAKRARAVAAVEIDAALESPLRETLKPYPNVTLHIMDGMKLDWSAWAREQSGPVRFVSNLPYYLTTPLLMRAFRQDPPFVGIACMVQKEVADKLLAAPGEDGYGPLAVWASVNYIPSVAMELPAAAFTPPPNVDSSFVICDPLREPLLTPKDYAPFGRLIDAAFAARRKTLRNNLRAGFGLTGEQAEALLDRAGLDGFVRAEDMKVGEFVRLYQQL
ncbi:ribosomal RNA small subunit methyltransferase A [Clostridia bacterium]|nr:ribosomal RNA small subunit methyltransferase A [Clostridia bacterium]